MEPGNVAYSATTDGRARYYIDTGVSSHLIKEIDALHDYIPFEVPRMITTAENGTIHAFGSGTLKFATQCNGKETKGELHNVYYILEIRHRFISVGKLFSQGWEPRLSRNGFALLQTIYPHFGFVAGGADNEMLDEKLFEHLENGDEYPPTAFSADDLPKLDSCPSCALAKAQRSPFKTGRARPRR